MSTGPKVFCMIKRKTEWKNRPSMVAFLLRGSQNKTVSGHEEADSLYVYGLAPPKRGTFSGGSTGFFWEDTSQV